MGSFSADGRRGKLDISASEFCGRIRKYFRDKSEGFCDIGTTSPLSLLW